MKCLGCGTEISWDGKGVFCYTCPCGATVFYENENFCPPASLVIALAKGHELPHIDYYLGKSNHWSKIKEEMYQFLLKKGACWSWECEQCKERVIERAILEKENHLYPFEFHPALEQAIHYQTLRRA